MSKKANEKNDDVTNGRDMSRFINIYKPRDAVPGSDKGASSKAGALATVTEGQGEATASEEKWAYESAEEEVEEEEESEEDDVTSYIELQTK